MFETLTDDNFQLYAIKLYDNPANTMAEYNEDIRRLRYVKRLLKRFRVTGVISERLVLNHLIILGNCFGPGATRLLFLRVDSEDYSALKTFLLYLSRLPRIVKGINGIDIDTFSIPIDPTIVNILRKV